MAQGSPRKRRVWRPVYWERRQNAKARKKEHVQDLIEKALKQFTPRRLPNPRISYPVVWELVTLSERDFWV